MGSTTAQRAVVAVLIGFSIPLIGWALPGEKGPETLTGALLQGAVITVALLLTRALRDRTRSSAARTGQELRERQGHEADNGRPHHEAGAEQRGRATSTD